MTCPTNSVAIDATTNHITTSGYGYDLNGNMTNDGQNTLVYDGENRLTSSSGGLGQGTYTYDGNALRVKKVSGSTTTVYIFSGSKVIAEYVNGAVPASPTHEYIYSGSSMLAKVEGATVQYYYQDRHSVRGMTDSSGSKIGEQGHYPFGESWYAQNTTTKWQYTSYEHDAESNNDYAMAREYVNRLGRFSAPDPLAGFLTSAQSLNRYSYALNDPIANIDPYGTTCTPDKDGNLSGDTCHDDTGTGNDPQVVHVNASDRPDTTNADPLFLNFGQFITVLKRVVTPPQPQPPTAQPPQTPKPPQAQQPKPSYLGCVYGTALTDSLYAGAAAAGIVVVGSTAIMAVTGSYIGLEGTVAGGGLGLAIGITAAPEALMIGLTDGLAFGAVHGAVACAIGKG